MSYRQDKKTIRLSDIGNQTQLIGLADSRYTKKTIDSPSSGFQCLCYERKTSTSCIHVCEFKILIQVSKLNGKNYINFAPDKI
jgi:hypothetical protein